MKRSVSNLITVVLALTVLGASSIFALYVLPVITKIGEGVVEDIDVELNKPQEIIQQPSATIDPQDYFPLTYSERERLEPDTLDEQTIQDRKNFLTTVSEAVDILYNIKIDGIILENYTQTWRYTGEGGGYGSERNTEDAFSVDIVFADVKSTQWRITANGYADELFYLSCYEGDKDDPDMPASLTKTGFYLRDYDQENPKLESAISRFRTKLYSLKPISRLVTQENSSQELDLTLTAYDPELIWVVYLESNGRYLVSGIREDSLTPVCFSFLNFQTEMKTNQDIFWRFYNPYPYGSRPGNLE